MSEKPNSKSESFENTKVDLGEDLLEDVRTVTSLDASPGASESGGEPALSSEAAEEEELQRGEILLSEGLIDEAKKVFRSILRSNLNHVRAKTFLDEIQRREIQDLLSSESVRKRLGSEPDSDVESTRTAIADLEKELQLDFSKLERKVVPGLFPEQSDYERYRDRLERRLSSLSVRDRLDLGIAHLEMAMPEVSVMLFESVVRNESYRTQGMYLLCLALIQSGNAIEATIRLEPLVRELTLSESHKTDFLYLMGMAFERLGDEKKAKEFYRRVFTLSPRYRDVVEKLK